MGKDSPAAPAAPDYTAAAKATAAGNLDAARTATTANRVNQYTPYGSLEYSRVPGSFNQSGYDAAMTDYNQKLQNYNQGGGGQSTFNPYGFGGVDSGGSGGSAPVAPDRNSFYTGDPDQWQSTINLSPTGQKLLDYQNSASLGLGEQTTQALNRVGQSLSQPFDYSSVQDVQDASYKAQTDRLDPQWQQRQQMTETQLVNQGLRPGTEAYDNAMRDFNYGRTDAYGQARQNAINTAPQTYQMATSLRNQPLNELNALRTGSQVTNPTFTNAPQQGQTAGPDLLGAANSQYGAQMSGYNAQQASNSNFMSGLMGLGGQLGGAYMLM